MDLEINSVSSSELDPAKLATTLHPPRQNAVQQDKNSSNDFAGEMDEDEISQQMTQSYSEISFRSDELSPENDLTLSLTLESISKEDIQQRPMTLSCDTDHPSGSKPVIPLNLEGSVHMEGNMTHFVTEDLEHKIRLSSPVTKKDFQTTSRTSSPLYKPLYRQLLVPQVGQLDTTLINDLECEAQKMATSIDNLIENLSGILHSISSITADNVEVYKNAVSKMSDAMDSNIKSMYTMMAKAEEVTESMKVVEVYAARIKDIKRLVDLFETFV